MQPAEAKSDIRQRVAEARRLGQHAEALMKDAKVAETLAASKQLIACWRELAAEDADYLPELARSHGILSVRASRLGDAAQALESAIESVKHWRVLAEQDMGRYGVDLVNALVRLGPKVHRVHYRNSFAVREEAAELALRLLDIYGERHLLLAATLCRDLADIAGRYGYPAKGLQYAEKSVELWRRLADHDLLKYGPDFIRALKRLSTEQVSASGGWGKAPLREARRVQLARLLLRVRSAIPPMARG